MLIQLSLAESAWVEIVAGQQWRTQRGEVCTLTERRGNGWNAISPAGETYWFELRSFVRDGMLTRVA